jgi:hypothetical protein
MSIVILLAAILVLNIVFGVGHHQHGNVTIGAAFSWFVIGWVSFHLFILFIVQLPKLL